MGVQLLKCIDNNVCHELYVQWNLYKWGNLERFYSFPYKVTSFNGEVGNGGLNVQKPFCTHKITSIFGVLCIFQPKMQNFGNVCVIV